MRAAFFYDVACPFSYLVAERVERVLGEVEWVPAPAVGLDGGSRWAKFEATQALAERHAHAVRLPLVWPDRFPANSRHALRAASYAAEKPPALASRLRRCGLRSAAGSTSRIPRSWGSPPRAAGVPLEGCLAAARDPARDAPLWATARGLHARGVGRCRRCGSDAALSRANGSWPRVRRCSASTPCSVPSVSTEAEASTQAHGGRLIATRLRAHGVTKLFTLSGGHLFSIYDGCRAEGIEIVDVRHEQTAAFAAEGWAKVTRSSACAR